MFFISHANLSVFSEAFLVLCKKDHSQCFTLFSVWYYRTPSSQGKLSNSKSLSSSLYALTSAVPASPSYYFDCRCVAIPTYGITFLCTTFQTESLVVVTCFLPISFPWFLTFCSGILLSINIVMGCFDISNSLPYSCLNWSPGNSAADRPPLLVFSLLWSGWLQEARHNNLNWSCCWLRCSA